MTSSMSTSIMQVDHGAPSTCVSPVCMLPRVSSFGPIGIATRIRVVSWSVPLFHSIPSNVPSPYQDKSITEFIIWIALLTPAAHI